MLIICLFLTEPEPVYAYKRFAYEKTCMVEPYFFFTKYYVNKNAH